MESSSEKSQENRTENRHRFLERNPDYHTRALKSLFVQKRINYKALEKADRRKKRRRYIQEKP